MKLRYRLSALSIVVTIAVSLTMLLAPVAAGQSFDPPAANLARPANPLLAQAEVYASHYGVTVDEALSHFKIEEIAGNLDAELDSKEQATYAGLWIQHVPEFRVIVQFTRDGDATMARYVKEGLEGLIEIRHVAASHADLQRDHRDAIESLRNLGIPFDSGVDIIGNTVEITVTQDVRSQVDDAVRRSALTLPANVKLAVAQELAKPAVNIYGGLTLTNSYIGFFPGGF